MIYYVIELQSGDAGAVLPYAYNNRPDAEVKYHALLSAAAKSAVPSHTVMLVMWNGNVVKSETYEHGGEE